MRISCNGCRVLRKGCSENCSIRPCLDWIKTSESQANATVFLAKFYGRAGLMNLINAGTPNLRPAIFRSLLYEACGRIVNPIYGSVGLVWSGSWQLCQNAVEAVLIGAPITQITTDPKNGPPFKACDIRHVNKDDNCSGSGELGRVKTRPRFKRSGGKKLKRSRVVVGSDDSGHESSLSHQSEAVEPIVESESLDSVDNVDPGHVIGSDSGRVELDLTLGFEPFKRCVKPREASGSGDEESGLFKMELGLAYPDS